MQKKFRPWIAFVALQLLVAAPLSQTIKASSDASLDGDWKIRTDFGEWELDSILSFTKDEENEIEGWWISIFGMSELVEAEFDGHRLSFVQSLGGNGEAMRSKFSGAIKEGVLTGTLSGNRGESKVIGNRIAPPPPAAGEWAMEIPMEEKTITEILMLKSDDQGVLTAAWQGRNGKSELSDVRFKGDGLKFKRTIQLEGQKWEDHFEGTIRNNQIRGVFHSDQGETAVSGERFGGSAVGTWLLDFDSPRAPRRHRLKINPDLSALYGASSIEKIQFENNRIHFNTTIQIGADKLDLTFHGNIDGDVMSAKIETGQSSRRIAGKRQVADP